MKTLDFKPKMFSAIKHYDKKTFLADLMAGIIVGIVALPLAIAFGIASGVSPEKGIITAIVAGLMISLFGGSKVQIGGPTGAFIVIVYGIIQQYGIQGLTIATLMAGVFLILLGVLRLGTIIKYIPYPIVVGFTSGIAVTIFTTQIKDLFGMTMDVVPTDFVEKWIAYFSNLGNIDPWSAVMGLASVVIIAAWPILARMFRLSPTPRFSGGNHRHYHRHLITETVCGCHLYRDHRRPFQHQLPTAWRCRTSPLVGDYQGTGRTSGHHCRPGSYRVITLRYRCGWCHW